MKDLAEARLMILRNHGTLVLGKMLRKHLQNIYFLKKRAFIVILSGNLELNVPQRNTETTRQQGEGREMAAALL